MTESMKVTVDKVKDAMNFAMIAFADELDTTEKERKYWLEQQQQLKAKDKELEQREKVVGNRENSVRDIGQIAADRLLEKKVAQESAEQSNAKCKKAEKERDEARAEKKRFEDVIETLIKEKKQLAAEVEELRKDRNALEAMVPVQGGPQ